MDAMEALRGRRSIRRYTAEPVPEALTVEILQAAMSAPSAGNEQPWHFVVITDRRLLGEIPRIHPYAQMSKEAAVAILVCGDLHRDRLDGFWVQDCSAATENILVAAHARGLGAVWVGIYPREERVVAFRRLLGIPEHVVPFALVPMGHPAEQKPPADRYDPERVHQNSW